jgi:Transcriptional regulator, AbiEi antitoxin
MRMSRACEELLERQSGVIARSQALQAGLSSDAIDNLLRVGRWQRLQHGVYATFSGKPSRDARLWAAVLRAGPDAMLSHYTAAGLFGLLAPTGGPVHVIVRSDRRPRRISGMVIHRADRAPGVRHPVLLPPRTRIEETVLDLATAARTADDAFSWVFRATGQRLTTPERIRRSMAARQRMPWRSELAACLDDAADGVHSNLERRYVWDVERPHGLPRALRQARVVRDGRVAYLDNLYPEYLVGAELDGRAAHPVGERWRDYRRDNAGATDGIITLRYGWSDVTGQPCQVAAQVAAVLAQRGWPGPPRRCGSTCGLALLRAP